MARQPNTIRIIGGDLRGRKLSFPDADGLRPTPDRVRETLFNWLQPIIHGARCLDLFAGSGALGLEALSRGAGSVVFVERDTSVCRALRSNIEKLKLQAECLHMPAHTYLRNQGDPFDIVFFDPPYRSDEYRLLEDIINSDWLAGDARIYLERPKKSDLPDLPKAWDVLKQSRAGDVLACLLGKA